MRNYKRILAGVLTAAMVAAGCYVPGVAVAEDTVPAVTALPGTTRTFSDFNASFLSVTGFARSTGADDPEDDWKVHDRTDAINTERYRVVANEKDFLEALVDARDDEVDVIELVADLDLGWDALTPEEQKIGPAEKYGWEMRSTITNPSIIESGISQLTISDTHGLTIFSRAGNTVKHAEWKLQGTSSDIVIRNLKFDEMWMCNDAKADDNKSGGWTLMKLNGVKGVWLDHCTFTLGYDGNMDSENGASNMTSSWNVYSMEADENPDPNSMIYKTIMYLEEQYQAGTLTPDNSVYAQRRQTATPGEIMAYEAFHNKFNLNGSGEKDFKDGEGQEDGNQRLHLTMAYNKIYNIGQRFPLLRQGTVHYVNCYVDNSSHKTYAQKLGVRYSPTGASARDGASVGMDTCVFNEMDTIVGGEEVQTTATPNVMDKWKVAFSGALNHTLVVNSKATVNGVSYTGSSWDDNGENIFTKNFSYNNDKKSIGDFYWFSHIKDADTDAYTRDVPPTDENGQYVPFEFTYDRELGYNYQALPLEDVESVIDAHAGAYVYNEDPEFWLRTDYTENDTFQTVAEKGETVGVTGLDLNGVNDTDEEGNVIPFALRVGTPRQVTVDVYPSHATNKKLTWSSSDESVVEVRDSGLLVAKKAGTAQITVTAEGTAAREAVSETFEVQVVTPVTSISIENAPENIYLGDENTPPEKIQLKAVVLPEDATNKAVVWSSSSSALDVDENGVLTPVKKASSIRVTCTSVDNPSVSKTIRIAVKEGVNPDATAEPSQEPSEPPVNPSDEPSEPPVNPSEEPVLYGDANGDNSVTADDSLAILKYVVKLQDLTETQLKAADVNNSEDVTADDSLCILKRLVNLIDHFPVEEK